MPVLTPPQEKNSTYNKQLVHKYHETLRNSVERVMKRYLSHIDGQDVTNIYDMVLSEIEPPLLETIMTYVKGNQSRAASILGLNRGTLRKKLKQHGLLIKDPDLNDSTF